MGTRTIVGVVDGTQAGAAMYDSTSGWMIGPIWEGDDASEQIDAFCTWLRQLRFIRLSEDIGLDHADLPRYGDGDDPRAWPDSGLQKLIAYWKRENLDDEGYLREGVESA